MTHPILLGVNIDHVATIRQARHTIYPDPIEAAHAAIAGGADGITVHLREDRRHIQARDVEALATIPGIRLNLEMAVTEPMLTFAEKIKPLFCCLVPEKREELTTEGGLDVSAQSSLIRDGIDRLKEVGSTVSLFIDPDLKQIESAHAVGATYIEIHTGTYAEARSSDDKARELKRILTAIQFAKKAGLTVNAGHGLNIQNVTDIASLPDIHELNIGHAIVARAIFIGLTEAVREMKQLMNNARGIS